MSKIMKLPTDQGLLPESFYVGGVDKVEFDPAEDPKKVILQFKIPEHSGTVSKEYPYSFRNGSTLRKDTEVLIGRPLNHQELENGFDFDQCLEKKANLAVFHRAGAGGKPNLAVALVLPIDKTA